ncbi:S8 family peptidase [Streptomyces sp. W16]|uniref:S8 family peptidase n=1 Tax=Streptomyces sp. W16 TaxID=3076631 RepID=UPI00295B5E4B|nr:S8 family peptidase [Streptomyces sp. W16]MDV9171975.1 S8 family peptidase [Streptomyces sp. W16]
MSTPVSSTYPLLAFPEHGKAQRQKLNGGTQSNVRFPGAAAQKARLGGAWRALHEMLDKQNASIEAELSGVDPELVLVLEIIGDVDDFYKAVSKIKGFEYLAEVDKSDIDGEGNFVDLDKPGAHFDGTLFMLASNQEGLKDVLKLWNGYKSDRQKFPRGLTPWRNVFQRLIDLRRWSAKDRLRGTGVLEDFAARVEDGQESVPVEIELWYRNDPSRQQDAEARVRALVTSTGGQFLGGSLISDIGYHGILAHLPIQSIHSILDEQYDDVALIRAQEIAFFRPEAQSAIPLEDLAELETPETLPSSQRPTQAPLVAVLDGFPLAQHVSLRDGVIIDDPDGWESEVQASDRQHGTAVSSLILHGDIGSNEAESMRRPIYVRPVLKPEQSWNSVAERIPGDQLAIDLVHRSLVRLLSSEELVRNGRVRLVNLSLGDASLQLAATMSPWARLLDWLAYKYQVLFVISAGNHPHSLIFPHTPDTFETLAPEKIRQETLRIIVESAERRRILSPSEAVNGLCVGASHDDASGDAFLAGYRIDPLPGAPRGTESLPSPVSAIGMGYRRSIKPDLLAPGGRTLFRQLPSGGQAESTVLNFVPSSIAPGLLTASPAGPPGSLNGTRYFHGTSGAAALTSHHGGLFLEFLSRVRFNGKEVPEKYWAVLTKAALVHCVRYPDVAQEIRDALTEIPKERLREALSRFYGYGVLDAERMRLCAVNRATVFGWGELADGEGDVYRFPLPPSLAGKTVPRRFVVTLSYFSPIVRSDRKHRAAHLYFIPSTNELQVKRTDADWQSVRRGTVQHEVMNGERAAVFVDGDSIVVQVSCRSLVGKVTERVPYGLAVTLETPEESRLQIHSEVAARLRLRTRVRLGGDSD